MKREREASDWIITGYQDLPGPSRTYRGLPTTYRAASGRERCWMHNLGSLFCGRRVGARGLHGGRAFPTKFATKFWKDGFPGSI